MNHFLPFVLFTVVVLLSACPTEESMCTSDLECFDGEVCVGGQCGPPVQNNVNNVNNSDGGINNLNNINNRADMSADDMSNGDMVSSDAGGDMAVGACVVDRFSSCDDPFEPPRNDSWTDAERIPNSAGCVNNRDTLIPFDATVTGLMCHNEPADYYVKTVVPCDTVTMAFRAVLTPEPGCRDEVGFEIKRGGFTITCDNPDFPINCRTEGDSQIIELVMPPDDSVYSMYVGVLQPDTEDRRVNYTLEMSLQ